MSVVVNFLVILFCIGYAWLHINFIWGWLKIPIFKPSISGNKHHTKVTVIVAARNEEQLIASTIDAILAQNYPLGLFELIVVDDHSTDNTAEIVRSYRQENIRLVQLRDEENINSYKKKAIETAISLALGDLIVTTDADCVMGKNWLSTVVSVYEETGHKMISSPVAYFNEKTIFERAQTLEFAYLIGLGAASIANQSAGTCNGANLAYQKAAFFSVDGFKGIDQLASGDDELLMHKIAAKYPGQLSFLKNTDAIVYTYAKPNLSEFITQRRRWASKSTQYKAKGMMYMAIFVWIFNLSIALNLLVAIFTGQYLPLVFQLVSKLLIEFSFVSVVMSFFRRRKLLYLLPLLTLVHTPYIIYIGIMGNSGKYNWKGRQVR